LRQIKIKQGTSKYKLRSDSNVYLGELEISYYLNGTLHIDIKEKGSSLKVLSIGQK